MLYIRPNSKSKLKAIFVHCICILLDLCRKSEDSHENLIGWLLSYTIYNFIPAVFQSASFPGPYLVLQF